MVVATPHDPSYGLPDNYSATAQTIMGPGVGEAIDPGTMGGTDPAPPGEGPDPDELAMLGIDPSDSTV